MLPDAESAAGAVHIVHRDEALLVLSKPAGLSTTSPGGEAHTPCLVDHAHRLDPGAPRLHPSSRLDREVTGLVTFARTEDATLGLLEARRRGGYRRLYVGLAAAAPADDGPWTEAIGIDPRDRRFRVAVPAGAAGVGTKRAVTHVRVGPRSSLVTWLWLSPGTGRTHQLRVHAAHHGSPLLGDVHYGGALRSTAESGRVFLHRRVMLHCAALVLPDLARREGQLELFAPLPDDFVTLWTRTGGDVHSLERDAVFSALYAFPVPE